jgi:hypothetical protein
MLIMIPRWRVSPPLFNVSRREAYIKISKLDCNGNNNSIPLGQINNLLIKYTSNSTYTNYQVLDISEFQTYYLYRINNQDVDLAGAGMDNEVKNYYVSSSITSSRLLPSLATAFPLN